MLEEPLFVFVPRPPSLLEEERRTRDQYLSRQSRLPRSPSFPCPQRLGWAIFLALGRPDQHGSDNRYQISSIWQTGCSS